MTVFRLDAETPLTVCVELVVNLISPPACRTSAPSATGWAATEQVHDDIVGNMQMLSWQHTLQTGLYLRERTDKVEFPVSVLLG